MTFVSPLFGAVQPTEWLQGYVVFPIVTQQLNAIQGLCRKYRVRRLELFGSAATGPFDETRSDLDFLVEFEALTPVERADAYFGLLASLQDLFRRDVDLVETGAIQNPYFAQTVNLGRTVLYAA